MMQPSAMPKERVMLHRMNREATRRWYGGSLATTKMIVAGSGNDGARQHEVASVAKEQGAASGEQQRARGGATVRGRRKRTGVTR
ncbi:hypothetical protein GUJ93_ZPchr0012g20240 [Zizania palustris]|uniref:Uncharacterized protein n=1 Tax=Zizania palustris TaxID=103762 RepID=A0A8J5WHD9_ZIZPA|nr:hypothetical protein GUJ93_ZPchr0012g20240 [Zizania palustris]